MLMFMGSLIIFSLKHKHFLLMLLSLELIVLILYFNMFLLFLMYDYELYLLKIYLIMSVCEGVLGLSLLVCMIRSYGNDYMKNLIILW
uniref:NADH-ubiquinone oxidoreductase chain 4L n=1 Tax=Pselaphinae sp. 2 EF-2015 TaxID=1756856 RepID=A0A0S2M8G4_9COLE|nr:NADH deshydrogenase subunit 4L [Pselaphinae sp. 2 EF-2015]